MGNNRILLYGFIALVIVSGFYFSSKIKFETDLEAYSLASSENIEHYESLQSGFPSSNKKETILILENSNGWTDFDDFLLLKELNNYWDNQPEVSRSRSISTLRIPRKTALAIKNEAFLNLKNKGVFDKRMSRWDKYQDITGSFISKNKQYALLFVTSENGLTSKSRDTFVEAVNKKNGISVHFVQHQIFQKEMESTMQKDAIWLAIISTLLILMSFLLLTKTLRGLFLILAMVSFNIGATMIFMYFLGMSFTIHMITIPCIVIILSFTDIMHIIYHQRIESQKELGDKELQKRIIKKVKVPMIITSLSNVIGFIVFLVLSENQHLINFSLISIIGVTIAYLSSRFIVIRFMNKNRLFIKRMNFSKLNQFHAKIFQFILSRKRIMLSIVISFTLSLLFYLPNIFSIDSNDADYEIRNSEFSRARNILQKDFFGSKQVEIIVQSKSSIWTVLDLKKIESIEKEINEVFQPVFINSPVLIAKRYHRFLRNGHPAAFTIQKFISEKNRNTLNRYHETLGGYGIIANSFKTSKILFGYKDLGLRKSLEQYDRLEQILHKYESNDLHFVLTGKQYIGDRGTYEFTIKILIGLGIGLLFSSLLTLAILKSIKKALGLIVVNSLPILVCISAMLILGISITPLSLFFLSLLIGICIDDSIYIVTQSPHQQKSLHIFPIFVTSIVLALGFLSLGFSNFQWIRPFAWVFLLGIGIAYLLDLFILPLFLDRNTIFGDDG